MPNAGKVQFDNVKNISQTHGKSAHFSLNCLCAAKIIFTCRFSGASNIYDDFLGACIRGGFGYAFKGIACAARRKTCVDCIIGPACPYRAVFETPVPKDSNVMRKYVCTPHPYSLSARLIDSSTLEAVMTIFGNAARHIPYFILAFVRFGERGLGRSRSAFAVEKVESADLADGIRNLVFDGSPQKLDMDKLITITQRDVQTYLDALTTTGNITIYFSSPARIKINGSFRHEMRFSDIVLSLSRKLGLCAYFHCGAPSPVLYPRDFFDDAFSVKTVSNSLEWKELSRYSTRQQNRMSMGGYIGTITYEGPYEKYLPLLAWGSVLHVGKGASFGLGKYALKKER